MPRLKLDRKFTVEQDFAENRVPIWVVGHVGWFRAAHGSDCTFVRAKDSPEFATEALAEAEAARLNLLLPEDAAPVVVEHIWR